ncbi:MAG TPA: glycosyltransferase family 2 protein [Acidimicrobiales bacterium]|nr:glycosyltransferase family 2 protein [Acidimicrobiales bacterium]
MSRLPVGAVVVNYNAGPALTACVESLVANGVAEVCVVDNASVDDSLATLRRALEQGALGGTATGEGGTEGHAPVEVVEAGGNLGYGAGANLGAKSTSSPFLLVCNPDLVVGPGAVAALLRRLESDESLAVAGPLIRDAGGDVYPSGRAFPSLGDAIGHAFLGLVWGGNPFTRRYRRLGGEQHRQRQADWVSGSCFLVRRLAFESVGGFDESYFMYVEDVDLCWRLRRAGWGTFYEPEAEVVHSQGLSAARHPYRMLVAHHRSMWRFATRSAEGRERLLLPAMALGLVARLGLAWADHLLRPVRERALLTAKVRHRGPG